MMKHSVTFHFQGLKTPAVDEANLRSTGSDICLKSPNKDILDILTEMESLVKDVQSNGISQSSTSSALSYNSPAQSRYYEHLRSSSSEGSSEDVYSRVVSLASQLSSLYLLLSEDRQQLSAKLPPAVRYNLAQLADISCTRNDINSPDLVASTGSGVNELLYEQISHLQAEKSALIYQNSLLREQVHIQKFKMTEMEANLRQLHERAARTQEMLRQSEQRSPTLTVTSNPVQLFAEQEEELKSLTSSDPSDQTSFTSAQNSASPVIRKSSIDNGALMRADQGPSMRSSSLEHLSESIKFGGPATAGTLPKRASDLQRSGSYSERRKYGIRSGQSGDDKANSVPNLNDLEPSNHVVPGSVTPTAERRKVKKNNSFLRLFHKKSGNKTPVSGTGRITEEDDDFKRFSSNRNTTCSIISGRLENLPFARWDTERLAVWLNDLGLGMYVTACRSHVTDGNHLLRFTPIDMEKVLGMKSHLHRKKLHLAIRSALECGPPGNNILDEMDFLWVARWLDDIGLPQHKDAFHEARVDGRVLFYFTYDDLLDLKVTSVLHQQSIGRAIQCLRMQGWRSTCLVRRPLDRSNPNENVLLWTNHRTMEWLRSIDLSEYAANLRGSGVHGALMLLDPRFTGDSLADVLSIPPSKTLLRRHLTTHFVALVGRACQEHKRSFETLQGYQILQPGPKVKPRSRRHRDTTSEDLVCPLNFEVPGHVPHSVLPLGYKIQHVDFTELPRPESVVYPDDRLFNDSFVSTQDFA